MGSREFNQQRVPNRMEINFVVSHKTDLSLTDVFLRNSRGLKKDNAFIREKTHGALFASNGYFKSIF